MTFFGRWSIACFAVGLLTALFAPGREWRSADGTLICEGNLLEADDGHLRLVDAKGQIVPIELKDLSGDDAKYVAQVVRDQAERLRADKKKSATEAAAARKLVPVEAMTRPTDDKFPLTQPNITSWQGRPDPPAWNWPAPLDPQRVAQLPATRQYILPHNPSPYVAIFIRTGNESALERWDLVKGQRDGVIRGAFASTMSTDGKLVAALPSRNVDDSLGYGQESTGPIHVWSFGTGQLAIDITLPERGYAVNPLTFCADNGLMLLAGRMPRVFDISTGKVRAHLTIDQSIAESRKSISPGDHFLAALHEANEQIALIDTRNGAVAGSFPIPDLGHHGRDYLSFGFSQDGNKLYALFWQQDRYHLVAWNLADGKMALDLKLDPGAPLGVRHAYSVTDVPDFLEFRDIDAIMIQGFYLADMKTGALLWQRVSDKYYPRPITRLIGNSQMLVLQWSGDEKRFAVEPIPYDEIKSNRRAPK